MRPKGVADGKLVNIPVPLIKRLTDVVTQKVNLSVIMACAFNPVGEVRGKSLYIKYLMGDEDLFLRIEGLRGSWLPRNSC